LRLTSVTKKTGQKSNINVLENETSLKKDNALPNIFHEKKLQTLDKVKNDSPKISSKTPRMTAGEYDKSRNYSEI
jgi:hypothetical protein